MLRVVCRIVALPLLAAALLVDAAAAQDKPLDERIDELIEANRSPPLRGGDRDGVAAYAPAASDGEFLRRVYLDLAGRIPSATETRAFLADSDADKRAKVIDKLLASDEYVRRMSQAFHVMLT